MDNIERQGSTDSYPMDSAVEIRDICADTDSQNVVLIANSKDENGLQIKLDHTKLSRISLSDSHLVKSPRLSKQVSVADSGSQRGQLIPEKNSSDDKSGPEASEDSDTEIEEDFSIRGMFWSFVERIYAQPVVTLLTLVTLVLFATTICLKTLRPDDEWSEIAVWRWTLYFALLFPSWLVARFTLNVLTAAATNLGNCLCQTDDDKKLAIFDVILFLQRYRFPNKFFIWTALLTLIFALCFSPAYGVEDDLPSSGAEQWQTIFSNLLKVHVIVFIYATGVVLVDFIEFKYLHTFSCKNLIERIDENIFQEVVITGLSGYKAYRATLLLPGNVNETSKFKWESHSRREHAASRYILENKLPHALSVRLRLGSERMEVVVAAILKKISQNVRVTKQQQIKGRLVKEQILTEDEMIDNEVTNSKTVGSDYPKRRIWHIPKDTLQIETYASAFQGSSGKRVMKYQKDHLERTLLRICPDLDIKKAMCFLDPSGESETIALQSLTDTVIQVFNDRRNLIQSLKDSASVTAQIKSWIQVIVNIIIVLIAMLIVGVYGVDAWVGFTTFIVGFSFAFGGAIKNAFENFLFLYGTHPFDVGDIIFLGGTNRYLVERVRLQTTELSRCGEIRIVQNNAIRATEPLINLSRSKEQRVSCHYLVDALIVTNDFLQKLHDDMRLYFKMDPETYREDSFRIDSYQFFPPQKMKLTLIFTMPFSLSELRRSRVAQSMAAVYFAGSLQKLGAKYSVFSSTEKEQVFFVHESRFGADIPGVK